MAGTLQGKAVLITGAGSGIGRAAALACGREGARVAVADVDRKGGEETVRLVKSGGAESFFLHADVTQSAAVAEMVAGVVRTYGRLDCAVNNAGIAGAAFTPATEYSEEVWDRVLAINLKGVWLCMKHEIPQMLKGGGGSIVNTASIAGLIGSRIGVAYTASKHGVVGITRSVAIEYAAQGIRVNAVCPSWIETALTEPYTRANPQLNEMMAARLPVARLCTADDVANAIVWLCSDASSFVTGHALPVDGGWTAQ
jgi:NAD(P)-dependent dehydrogenase (short-subunit alcohol dehydrogenase family)